ncbi:hypothetical protein EJB05_25808 [Eragrostis curvula]|uniref:Bifunctional inhibitor/plant lipid transfer protein/seed storage helical domain-containing protein n=1 Tax=Eragrostis curvula TaxID=38414 RepID=A0A5J9UJF3_9POAL|nr:hypothetical protein EJB05_25734 [Eragrostis curvula]TVU23441.1 hypothetical protein EJB05_25808 [Eragrostis curvula]
MALGKQGGTATCVLLLAALLAMAMVFTSCHAAAQCQKVVPCDAATCFNYCQKNNFKNFQPICYPIGQGNPYYPTCCCSPRVA